MILDLQTMFSGTVAANGVKTGDAITVTAIGVNVLDRKGGQAGPTLEDEGILGHAEMWLVVQSLTAANGADAAKTLTITLESDTTANLATLPVVHFASKAILGAAILLGTTLVRVMMPSDDYKQFIGVRYTVSALFTAFSVVAYLTTDAQRNVIYPIGFTIDV